MVCSFRGCNLYCSVRKRTLTLNEFWMILGRASSSLYDFEGPVLERIISVLISLLFYFLILIFCHETSFSMKKNLAYISVSARPKSCICYFSRICNFTVTIACRNKGLQNISYKNCEFVYNITPTRDFQTLSSPTLIHPLMIIEAKYFT
jgi:hypothetical protein